MWLAFGRVQPSSRRGSGAEWDCEGHQVALGFATTPGHGIRSSTVGPVSTPPPPPFPPSNQPGQPGFGAPPPNYGVPGGPPPAPNYGAPGGPSPVPNYGGSGPTGGLTPGAAPPKKSKAPLIIVAVVVLAIVAAGIVLLTRKDDKGGSSLDGAAAHTTLRSLLDNAEFDASGIAGLDACPLGTVKALDALVAVKVPLDKALLRAGSSATAKDSTDVKPQRVACDQVVDDPTSIAKGPGGISYGALLNPPKDIDGYLKDAAAGGGKLTVGDTSSFDGGTIHAACLAAAGDTELPSCAGLWVDETNRIAIGVALIGDVTEKDAVAATKAIIPTAVKGLATFKASGGSASTDTTGGTDTTDTSGS